MITVGQHVSASKLVLEEIQINEFHIIIGGTIFVSNGLEQPKTYAFPHSNIQYHFSFLLFFPQTEKKNNKKIKIKITKHKTKIITKE